MIDATQQLTFTGTHFEIGKQIGDTYKNWGRHKLYANSTNEKIYKKQLILYKRFFPLYLEWLKGIAVGSDFDENQVTRTFLTEFLNLDGHPSTTCSVFSVHRNNKVFVGRNYDWREAAEESTHQLSIHFTDESTYSYTALSDMGVWEIGKKASSHDYTVLIEDAWNERGLFVCQNGAPGNNRVTGMSSLHIIQAVVEQCATTEEAIALITAIPCNEPKIFTIVDASGNMAVIEKPTDYPTQVQRSDSQIVATNHYQSDALKRHNAELFEDLPFHSTFARYAYLETFIKILDTIGTAEIKSGLLKPPVLQNWRGVDNGDYITAWIEILELSNLESDVCIAPLLQDLNITI